MVKKLLLGFSLFTAFIFPPSTPTYAETKIGTPLEVEYILKSFGYAIKVDGKIDNRTTKAIRHFQKVSGLYVDGIVGKNTWQALSNPATATQPAVRVNPPPAGLNGLPFAPAGLDECGQAQFYRQQFGLPERFDAIAWRESMCRNDVVSRTGCCYGTYQHFMSSHLRSPGYQDGLAGCQVDETSDIFGNNPLAQQKQACITKIIYDVSGFSPWAL